MPWSNQTGGGGNGGGGGGWNGGPWGQGPRNNGGNNNPPDLEELLRRSQDRLKRVLPGGGGSGGGGGRTNPLAIIAVVIVAVALVGYNFFTFRIDPDQLGIVLRFGEFNRQAQPGLNFRLPYPIETVYAPQVTRVNRITIGQESSDRPGGGSGRDIPQESLMLTGDENIVDIDFSVFWVIKDAKAFLFNIQQPEATVKAVAQSAMREIVGRSKITPLLTQARQLTESDVQTLMQAALDTYQAGIQVTQVQLLKVDPPADVISAFRDVQAARADQERVQNEAQTYANQVVPQARGRASQIVEAANADRDRTVAEAQGQADRFSKVYEAYRLAPDVTRKRMYLETMEGIFSGVGKTIIEAEGRTGVVPYLPLDRLQGGRGAGSSSSTTSGGAR